MTKGNATTVKAYVRKVKGKLIRVKSYIRRLPKRNSWNLKRGKLDQAFRQKSLVEKVKQKVREALEETSGGNYNGPTAEVWSDGKDVWIEWEASPSPMDIKPDGNSRRIFVSEPWEWDFGEDTSNWTKKDKEFGKGNVIDEAWGDVIDDVLLKLKSIKKGG